MSRWMRRTKLDIVALALLAALAGAYLDDFVHTDDGCAFETHCLACQRGVQSIGVIAADLAPPPTLERIELAVDPPTIAVYRTPIRGEAPRGPPQV